MGSRALLGRRGRLSILSGAVGPRGAEAGAAPSESADSRPLAAALRGRQLLSAPAVGWAAAEDQAAQGSCAAGPAPAPRKVLHCDGQALEGWGRTIRLALGGPGPPSSPPPPQPPRPSRECKPRRPPAAPLTPTPPGLPRRRDSVRTRRRSPPHRCRLPPGAASRHLGRARASERARAPEPDVSGPSPARAPKTPSFAVPAPAPPRRPL